MGDVIDFNGTTTEKVPVEKVFEDSKDCDDVLVIGWKGDDFWCATSNPRYGDNILLLEIARTALMGVIMSD